MMDNNEPLALSSHALAALAEFNAEKDTHEKHFENLKAKVEEDVAKGGRGINVPLSMTAFTEDWNMSQFWYSDETATLFASELLRDTTELDTVAVISAPSVFISLKNLLGELEPHRPRPRLLLLEHDKRFNVFPEFVFYDYQQPLRLPSYLKGTVSRIICDPPFLEDDCQTKCAITARWMVKSSGATSGRIIVNTGERMKDLVARVYKPFGIRPTTFEPVHAKGLGNEFWCYTNFECEHWTWRD